MKILEAHERSVVDFNAHDAAAVARVYAPDAVVHDPLEPEPIVGTDVAVFARADEAGRYREVWRYHDVAGVMLQLGLAD